MTGASSGTKRVRYLNANLDLGLGGRFEILVVTEDGERTSFFIGNEQMAALGPLLRADVVLLLDPDGPTLILANLVGEWLSPEWTAADPGSSPPASPVSEA